MCWQSPSGWRAKFFFTEQTREKLFLLMRFELYTSFNAIHTGQKENLLRKLYLNNWARKVREEEEEEGTYAISSVEWKIASNAICHSSNAPTRPVQRSAGPFFSYFNTGLFWMRDKSAKKCTFSCSWRSTCDNDGTNNARVRARTMTNGMRAYLEAE